jgi:hypothetical protein
MGAVFLKIRNEVYCEYQKFVLTASSEKQNIRTWIRQVRSSCGWGGEAVVASVTGTALTAPYRWQYPRERGGTDGLIPQRHHRRLLDYAAANGLALSAEDFLPRTAVA